jgi:phospholipase C
MTYHASAGDAVDHVVVLMLENRSFDHMLGLLYSDARNVSPSGQLFDGLSGDESNPATNGSPVVLRPIDGSGPVDYFMPGADPGEGFAATNLQLYASDAPSGDAAPAMNGFVTDFSSTLSWETKEGTWDIVAGTIASDIMGVFTPAALPVLSGLAKGYAVSDRWFSSVPTETMPNRAFASAATSQGHMDDTTKSFTAPTIFGLLEQSGVSWSIFGYDAEPLTRLTFSDTTNAAESHVGRFADFRTAAAAGTLSSFNFLEPSWSASGNSQHPNYDVALGEQLIYDVYEALRSSPLWPTTLLVVTYDEHGGCYDHVPPPSGTAAPDSTVGEFGFDFQRFGVRVPTVLVSPLIAPGTVLRPPASGPPFDHTSILKSLELRFGLPALTARDAAAPDFWSVLTEAVPRTDDPLSGVVVPTSGRSTPATARPSHLELVYAELAAELPVPGLPSAASVGVPHFKSGEAAARFAADRIERWKASRPLD